ncbi:MAG TPA: hypothetical protein VFB63_22150 [Bryobacteraceae bacterium]|nr:hypothetical protein [Bryobacteraceae bacterium]
MPSRAHQQIGPTAFLRAPPTLDGSENVVDRQILLPFGPTGCVIARARSIESKEACQAVDAELTPKNLQRVPFKLFVS